MDPNTGFEFNLQLLANKTGYRTNANGKDFLVGLNPAHQMECFLDLLDLFYIPVWELALEQRFEKERLFHRRVRGVTCHYPCPYFKISIDIEITII